VFARKDVDMEEGSRDATAARLAKGKEEAAERGTDANQKENLKRAPRKNPSTPTTDPQINSNLNVHPGSGSGRTSSKGEENQGPSPVDYSIELEVEFPKEMIVEMKGNVARKARRTVIGRTLGGRASFKTLQECLKLHLPATFVLVTLLTRGFFLILFENEEGATTTRKLAAVEWSGLNLSFSRYNPNFDTNAQGAEALLTHAIKVQFPDLHDQFRNERALTIMASKLREVLDIIVMTFFILHIKILHLAPCHNILYPRMFTKLHWLIYKFFKNSLKFLLLWASITFSHQECHNYA
jgi:hypothetical protein